MITCVVNGKLYDKWTSAEVERTIKAVSGRFSLQCFDSDFKIKAGDKCFVKYNDTPLITGRVEIVEYSCMGNSTTLTIGGRDNTGDLVDSGSLLSEKSFKGSNLNEIASALVQPFGIKIKCNTTKANNPILHAGLQFHETIWETINRLSVMQGVLVYPSGSGELVFNDVTKSVSYNLDQSFFIETKFNSDSSKLFRNYVVCAQSGSYGNETRTEKAKVIDQRVPTERTKIIISNKKIDENTAKLRANWERSVAIANSKSIELTAIGWDFNDKVWDINKLINLKFKDEKYNGTYLIETVKFSLSDQGLKTQLTCVLPESYNPDPIRNVVDEATND